MRRPAEEGASFPVALMIKAHPRRPASRKLTTIELIAQHQAGRADSPAVAAAQHSPALSDVPTCAGADFPDIVVDRRTAS